MGGEGGGGGLIERILEKHPKMFDDVLRNADGYRFQVLLSEVQEDDQGKPYLVRHGFRVDQEYFYPASAIKLCVVIAAMLKLKSLEKLIGLHLPCTSTLSFYPLIEGAEKELLDSSNLDGQRISISHEVRKILLVSDNKAFDRLYAFVGHRTINEAMWKLGFKSARLHHRLSARLSLEENKISEPIELDMGGSKATLAPKHSELLVPDISMLLGINVGAAHITPHGGLVLDPMDFSKKNYISLTDLQDLLVKIMRKDIELDTAPISISEDTRMMLMTAMSQYPSESSNPTYDKSDFPDDYCKFFLPGLARVCRKGALRIFNKAGRAYGFTVDNSYIANIETGQSFFLSATIYTNANEVVNDDKYEYNFADAVMADLAEVIAQEIWQVPICVYASSRADCMPSSLWDAPGLSIPPLAVSEAANISLQPAFGMEPEMQFSQLTCLSVKRSEYTCKITESEGIIFSETSAGVELKEENDVSNDIFASKRTSFTTASTTDREMFINNTRQASDTPAQAPGLHRLHDVSCNPRADLLSLWPSCPLNQPYVCSSKQKSSECALHGSSSSSAEFVPDHHRQTHPQVVSLIGKTYMYFVDQ